MEEKSLHHLEFSKVLALIAGYAGSKAAKEAILALRPAIERRQIVQSLDELDELLGFLDRGFHLPIGGLREVRDILEQLRGGRDVLDGDDFLRVRSNLEVVREVRRSFQDAPAMPLLQAKLDGLPDLSPLHREISLTINDKGAVRDDASPRLAGIRRDLLKARQELEKRLTEYLHSQGDAFSDSFFTLRNERYVVPVKVGSQSQIQGIVHDESGSGQTLFMEPLEFLAGNNRLARLKSEEREEVMRILRSLTQLLSSNLTGLQHTFDTLVFFDQLHARARFARAYDAHRPEIAPDGSLELIQARHPLLHPHCVPLDLKMGGNTNCLVITGPNGGGKTVALKITGINALLMQCGCFVLASVNSRLPIFEHVLSDIGESQSIEEHLSTFTSHLQRLNEILRDAGARSLILIDEIGVGTDPQEGAALAQGVLKALVRRGCLTLVTSHYHALKHLAFTTPGFQNGCMEFDEESRRPTFRFLAGASGRSNALAMARQFRLPDEVLAEMVQTLEGRGGDEIKLLEGLERERAQAEQVRRSLQERDRQLAQQQAELDREVQKLSQFRRTRRDELTETFEREFKARLKQLETLIHDLRHPQPEISATAALDQARTALQETRQAIEALEGEKAATAAEKPEILDQPPEIGDEVIWPRFNLRGRLESLENNGRQALIEANGKKMSVPFGELQAIRSARRPSGSTGHAFVAASPTPVPEELDLRGMRVEEALHRSEEYLKNAEAMKLPKVHLIHGKGTGALQRAIHEFLKRSPWKARFRFGRYGEGDLGVTVVVFDPASDPTPTAENQPTFGPRPRKGTKR